MASINRPSAPRAIVHAWAVIACCFGLTVPAAPAENETVLLLPGRSVTLSFENDIGTALIVDPDTADVEVLDIRNIAVLGYAPGITRLDVYDTSNALLGTYQVEVRTQQSEDAQAVVSRIVGEDADIRVDSIGDTLFVAGEAKSPSQAELVMRAVRTVAGETQVVDAVSLDSPVQVNLEAVISEVSRNVTRELGIDWSLDINPFAHPLRTMVSGVRLGTGALQIADVYSQALSFARCFPRICLPASAGWWKKRQRTRSRPNCRPRSPAWFEVPGEAMAASSLRTTRISTAPSIVRPLSWKPWRKTAWPWSWPGRTLPR